MRSEVMNISPEQASIFLGANVSDNRRRRSAWVNEFVGIIERGEWKLTHQGVAISKSGRLIDGQHRLDAIVRTGATLPMLVTFDVADDAFLVLDQGHRRSTADATGLTIREVSAIRLALLLHDDRRSSGGNQGGYEAIQVKAAAPAFTPFFRCLTDGISKASAKRSAAPILLGVASLLIGASDARQEELAAMFRAFNYLDSKNYPESVAALNRQLENGSCHSANLPGQLDQVVRARMAFHPTYAQSGTINVRNREMHLQAITADVRAMMRTK